MRTCTVLGAGAWGTALAKLVAENGLEVTAWTTEPSVADDINLRHRNDRYLAGFELPPNLRASLDMGEAIASADMVLFVIPSHATREVARLAAPHLRPGVPIVSCTKGIENDSLMFMDEVLQEELPVSVHNDLAFLSGPSFAKELAQRQPTVVVVASRTPEVFDKVCEGVKGPYFRVYASDDIVGVECGGALKNVIAIAAGVADGMGFGFNTRAALITRGLAEIAKIAMVRGGSALTVAGLSGMGDLVLTCTGELSRNRTVGVELGKGRKLEDILAGLGHVAEGVKTAKSAQGLAEKLGVDCPITREVYLALYEGKSAKDALGALMSRELGYEFDRAAIARATLKKEES